MVLCNFSISTRRFLYILYSRIFCLHCNGDTYVFCLGRRWTSWIGRGTAPPLSSTLSTPPLRTAFSSLPASFRSHFFIVHCKENPIFVFLEKKLRALSPSFCERFIYSQDRSTYFFAAESGRLIVGIYTTLTEA